MPIYEYQCEGCGHQMEAMQSIKDAPLVNCPECHEDRLRKQISAAGFRLKGSGWYVTDFRDGGKKKDGAGGKEAAKASDGDAAPKAAASTDASGSSASASSDSTPAAKPASGGGGGSES